MDFSSRLLELVCGFCKLLFSFSGHQEIIFLVRENPFLALFHPGLAWESEGREAVKGWQTSHRSRRLGSPCQAQNNLLLQVKLDWCLCIVYSVYFHASPNRTHSQLNQAVAELARTTYRYMKVSKFPFSIQLNKEKIREGMMIFENKRWPFWDLGTSYVLTLQSWKPNQAAKSITCAKYSPVTQIILI